jgi:hypothetical protein
VSGTAAFCTGLPLTKVHPRPGPIAVYAHKAGLTVASNKVPASGGHYLLLLAAGTYVISAPASRHQPTTITVHAGEKITVNFRNTCR